MTYSLFLLRKYSFSVNYHEEEEKNTWEKTIQQFSCFRIKKFKCPIYHPEKKGAGEFWIETGHTHQKTVE